MKKYYTTANFLNDKVKEMKDLCSELGCASSFLSYNNKTLEAELLSDRTLEAKRQDMFELFENIMKKREEIINSIKEKGNHND